MIQKPQIQNTLFIGDNLHVLHGLNSQSIDLIYLDPPFNSKRIYSAYEKSRSAGSSFKDIWSWKDVDESLLEGLMSDHPIITQFIKSIGLTHSKAMMAYITYMTQRLIQLHRVLKNTGSLYLHVDPTASHYLKIVLDNIFGKDNFKNEIIWAYRTGGSSKKQFSKKHDVILWYTKSKKYTFNPQKEKAYTKSKSRKAGVTNYGAGSAEFFEDSGGVYNMVNMRDVWNISYINSQSSERTGYPTQKPLELLQRIVKASSNEGDVVLDPFCGCATTCVAAAREGRRWIGIDIEQNASKVLLQRFEADIFFSSAGTKDFIHRTDIPVRTDVQTTPITPKTKKDIKQKLFDTQKGKCNACATQFRILDLEIDHIIPKSKGGADYMQNYQLLCANCNRTKGDRPMSYLRAKIAQRENVLAKIRFGE